MASRSPTRSCHSDQILPFWGDKMRKLLPVLLALLGLGGGVGAGVMLRPAPADPALISPCGKTPAEGQEPDVTADADHSASEPAGGDAGPPSREYVKLNNQFIVPIVGNGVVEALVILSVSLEVKSGSTEKVYLLEPKLRDALLQVLFDHANSGGFDGAFTNSNNMEILRVALLETARKSLGSLVSDVLIVDIVRQDT